MLELPGLRMVFVWGGVMIDKADLLEYQELIEWSDASVDMPETKRGVLLAAENGFVMVGAFIPGKGWIELATGRYWQLETFYAWAPVPKGPFHKERG